MTTLYSQRANKFLRNSLLGKTNKTQDEFLSKLEDKIFSMGDYIKQRYGQETYDSILNTVGSS